MIGVIPSPRLQALFLILNHKRMIEKEELLKGFGDKLGEPDAAGNYEKIGITSRTLDTYVDAIAKTGIEEAGEGFYATHLAILESMGGQMRKEKADFVKSYKSNAGEEQGNKAQEPGEPKPENDSDLVVLKEQLTKMQELNTSLSQRLDAIENGAKKAETTQAVAEAMRAKGASDAYVLKNTLKRLQIEEGKSAEEMAEALMSAYDKELKECRGDGAQPRMGGNGGATETAADRYFAQKRWKQD